MVQDFNAGYSQKLVEWADAFYRRHGFEIEARPAPGGKAQEAYRYCLAKSDGFELDAASANDFLERLAKVKRPVWIEEIKIYNEIRELEKKERDKRQELDAELGKFSTLPQADWPGLVARLTTLFDEYQAVTAELAAKRTRHAEIEQQLVEIDRQHRKELDLHDFDTRARQAIGTKVLRSLDLSLLTKVRTGAENADVVDATRLKVLFCRFRLGPSMMVMRPGPQPHGKTRPAIGANSVNAEGLWNGMYILINLNKQERITLAHEIVHATDRWHPPSVTQIKDLRSWVRSIQSDPVTGKIVFPTITEEVPGGYYDGPEDDILNYNSMGKKPDEVKLYPDDQARLEQTFFVLPPP